MIQIRTYTVFSQCLKHDEIKKNLSKRTRNFRSFVNSERAFDHPDQHILCVLYLLNISVQCFPALVFLNLATSSLASSRAMKSSFSREASFTALNPAYLVERISNKKGNHDSFFFPNANVFFSSLCRHGQGRGEGREGDVDVGRLLRPQDELPPVGQERLQLRQRSLLGLFQAGAPGLGREAQDLKVNSHIKTG